MANSNESLDQYFDENLFGYLNNTLDADERESFERHLRGNGLARSELAWYQELKSEMHENFERISPDVGLKRSLQKVRGEPQPLIARMMQGLVKLLNAMATPQHVAVAGALVVIQGAIIAGLVATWRAEMPEEQASASMTRSLATTSYATAVLRVKFKPNAKLQDIGSLLTKVDGSIVEGPGQGGYYLVIIASGRLIDAAEKLRLSNVAEEVVLIPPNTKQK
jgi:hypothetical protein